ncbi:MAG: o-succinylbenzoate synthase [Acidobacteria bacterium]|nr:o-succinylbenzoate synthase [Acidobacteriota bacterium]
MKLDFITLREIRMPMLFRFETSFGQTTDRRIILVEVSGEGAAGWGEVTAGEGPFYNEEDTDTAWHVLSTFVIPKVLDEPIQSAASASGLWEPVRGHRMATGGLEAALWDWEARLAGRSLSSLIGGTVREIPCGVSIGIQSTVEQLLERIASELAAGYQRIKIKIKPGWDVEVLDRVREKFPRVPLMVDANSAYTLADRGHLKLLDRFYLMMIEQPLAHDDLLDHAKLQQYIDTPICLDESIRTLRHAEQAAEIGACRIINIKLGRVGGFSNARHIHDCCRDAKIPNWCGGMLESGIGRAHNVALSTLPNFVLPGDVAASKRYWKRDVITPEVEVTPRGSIEVPDRPGMGYEPDTAHIERLTIRKETFTCRR